MTCVKRVSSTCALLYLSFSNWFPYKFL